MPNGPTLHYPLLELGPWDWHAKHSGVPPSIYISTNTITFSHLFGKIRVTQTNVITHAAAGAETQFASKPCCSEALKHICVTAPTRRSIINNTILNYTLMFR